MSYNSRGGSRRGRMVFSSSRQRTQRPKGRGKYIDPSKFVNKAVAEAEQIEVIPTHKFSDFNLMPRLTQKLTERGYLSPTPIQDGAIKPALAGKDLIGLANTGTGKTAAFVLPMIHRLKHELRNRSALIIAPTRELAAQIDEEFRIFAKGLDIYSALCLGGINIRSQIQALSRRPQVIIGTPGRLKDLYNQRALHLGDVGILVLDEADRMLDMGFIKDIRFIISKLPRERQSLCFSATMPHEVKSLVNGILINPVTVSVRTTETSEQVEQDIIRADSKHQKIEILCDLLKKPEFQKVLIFGETKWSVQRLADTLNERGIKSEAIHGNKNQPQRQRSLKSFKEGHAKVLVATDVASRGLDIPNVSHVINFDQPSTYEDYIHRIGRTGRAGKRGIALTFVPNK